MNLSIMIEKRRRGDTIELSKLLQEDLETLGELNWE